MRTIDWNISCFGKTAGKAEYLGENAGEDCIILLQEVKPATLASLRTFFPGADFAFSLAHRPPGKYDGPERSLGTAVLTMGKYRIKNSFSPGRALFPDRVIMADVTGEGEDFRVCSFHSVTGAGYRKAKSVQFFAMAEILEEFSPDILGMDINEPETDRRDPADMKFFDNGDGGRGAATFLSAAGKQGLEDSYVLVSPKTPPFSFLIRGGKRKRYDFLYLKKDKFTPVRVNYDWRGATNAGSDHAAIIRDILLRSAGGDGNLLLY